MSPCGARGSLSSQSQTRGVTDFDLHFLNPQLSGLTSSHLQQQSQKPLYSPGRISSSPDPKSSELDVLHYNNQNAQLAHFDSGTPGCQDLAAEDLNGTLSGPSDVDPYLPLQAAGNSPQEQVLIATSQPLQLDDPARTIASTNLTRSPLPSPEDDFFNQFVHPYDSYEGEAIPADFDGRSWRLNDD